MAQFASATFTGTDGTDLPTADSNWTEHASYSAGQLIITDANRCRNANTSGAGYYHSGAPANANYEVSADFHFVSLSANFVGYVCARMSTSANTMYYGIARYNTGWQLWKIVGGTTTQLGSTSSKTFSAGVSYNMKIRVDGDQISLYTEGGSSPTIGPITDTAISAANKAGLRAISTSTPSNSVGIHIDNFSAGDLVSEVTLVVSNTSHAQIVDALTLTQNHVMVVADASHSQTTDNVGLLQNHIVSILDANHSQTVDNIVLSQNHVLVVDNTTHGQLADDLLLVVDGETVLSIQNGSHAQISDALTLSQNHILVILDALQAHTVDNVGITQEYLLSIQDSLHVQLSDSTALLQQHLLEIVDAFQAQIADNVVLNQNHTLIILSTQHAQGVVNVMLIAGVLVAYPNWLATVPSEGNWMQTVPTEDEWILTV